MSQNNRPAYKNALSTLPSGVTRKFYASLSSLVFFFFPFRPHLPPHLFQVASFAHRSEGGAGTRGSPREMFVNRKIVRSGSRPRRRARFPKRKHTRLTSRRRRYSGANVAESSSNLGRSPRARGAATTRPRGEKTRPARTHGNPLPRATLGHVREGQPRRASAPSVSFSLILCAHRTYE